jgi:hypothetical protein
VVAERDLSLIGRRPAQSVEHRVMLDDHLAEVVGLGQAETAHSAEVSLRALGDLPGEAVTAELADRGVKLVVEDREALEVGVGHHLLLTAHETVEGRDIGRIRPHRGDTDGGALERLAHELGVLHSGGADPRDERPSWGTTCTKRSSRRRATASRIGVRLTARRTLNSFSEIRWPGSQITGDDRLAQRLVDLAPGRASADPLGMPDPHVRHVCILTYK